MTDSTANNTPKSVSIFGENRTETKQQLLDAVTSLKQILQETIQTIN